MIFFQISTGVVSTDDATLGSAYSGAPGFVDNPDDEALKDRGPIPEGVWAVGAPIDDPHTGPYSLPLTPWQGTMTFGRGSFLIHGDNAAHDHTASCGCIVAEPRGLREAIWADPDHLVTVRA